MKYFLWCLLLMAQQGWAQNSESISDAQIANASGNPYLFKDWMDGVVYFKSGRVVKQFKLKFDCARNRLMLQFEGAAFAAESQVKGFVIYTAKKNKDSVSFTKGFPPIEKNTEDTYYQVLVSGKVTLLQLHGRVLVEEKQLVNSGNHTRLEEEDLFYVLIDGNITLLPNDKQEVLKKLPTQPAALQEFVAKESLRMDKAADYVKIITKYNELVP
ncbi:hypothetical protein [Paraflavitalea sp. CAU 1676]|uniref:hypothetical protein n=1 Tax=Paraflavitalea sp. CAU 1676 TaxID=3032598 RepID=UPI0023DA9964|nr:hypothetical protein [Paraflavitalea sp. CAU 1676]MDF2187796.1 hypothetical protein [Paraflavitalea sp. CAU 1676]